MFYRARFSLHYKAAGAQQRLALVRYDLDVFTAAPEWTWEWQTEQRNYIGSHWGEDVPTGNARYKLSYKVLREYPTVAQMELELRARELSLATGRAGEVELLEAYHHGAPAMRTRWHATLEELQVQRIYEPSEALALGYTPEALRGKANAVVSEAWTLTPAQGETFVI